MCKPIEGANLAPGWICCCKAYNGLQRQNCKICDHKRCTDVDGKLDAPQSIPVDVVSSLSNDFGIAMGAIERFLLTVECQPIFNGLSLMEAMWLFKENGGLDSVAPILARISETFLRLPTATEAQALGLAAFMNSSKTKVESN